jgi:hypothetical protein
VHVRFILRSVGLNLEIEYIEIIQIELPPLIKKLRTMFRHRFLPLFVICLCSVGFIQAQKGMLGEWKGTLIERGRSNPYKVSITFRNSPSGALEGTIWYADYGCGGMLKHLETRPDGVVIFVEKLYSAEKCLDNGQAAFMLDGETLRMIWRHADHQFQAEGSLKRY